MTSAPPDETTHDALDHVWGCLDAIACAQDDLDRLPRLLTEALGISPAWHEHRLPVEITDVLLDIRRAVADARFFAKWLEEEPHREAVP